EDAETILHDRIIGDQTLSSVTVIDDIAVIRVLGAELPNQPGIMREIVDPIADARINVVDIITSATSVAVFVDWSDREETLEIIQEHFEG
ncbi:MAG: ACT domain-containing protein, partial [Halanaeroarchaeum sp.]